MEKIGEKIKRIRKANGWSQDAVLPEHQSLVSQIEKGSGKGGIMNPGRGTLEKIAKNMEMTFNELIEDTDWDPTKETFSTNEYAFSTTEATVKLEESGEMIIIMKSYPRYNEKGEENKYSPENGRRLVTKCEPCERSIESPTQRYCMSCGNPLNEAWGSSWSKLKRDFWYSLDSNTEEIDRVSRLIENEQKYWGEALRLSEYHKAGQELGEHFGYDDGINVAEFNQGYSSPSRTVRHLWEMHDYNQSVLTGLLYELKRWTVKIVSGEVEPPPVKGNDKDSKEDDLPF